MLTVYKYPLAITDVQTVMLPSGARLLSVQVQNGQLCLWALVDPSNVVTTRTVVIHGTGYPIYEEPRQFIGTVQMGGLVWHVFEGADDGR